MQFCTSQLIKLIIC